MSARLGKAGRPSAGRRAADVDRIGGDPVERTGGQAADGDGVGKACMYPGNDRRRKAGAGLIDGLACDPIILPVD